MLKNFLAGSLKNLNVGNFAEAEIFLLKASLISNDPVIEMMRAKVMELSEFDPEQQIYEALNDCYSKNSCLEKLNNLQKSYCLGQNLSDIDYKLFILLGGKALEKSSCKNEALLNAIYILKSDIDYYHFLKPKILKNLNTNQEKILNLTERYLNKGNTIYINLIPADVIFLLSQ